MWANVLRLKQREKIYHSRYLLTRQTHCRKNLCYQGFSYKMTQVLISINALQGSWAAENK